MKNIDNQDKIFLPKINLPRDQYYFSLAVGMMDQIYPKNTKRNIEDICDITYNEYVQSKQFDSQIPDKYASKLAYEFLFEIIEMEIKQKYYRDN